MTFLVQTYEGKVLHDFSFTLIESVKYQNWYTNTNDFQIIFTDNPTPIPQCGIIPCGSNEFVTKYLNTMGKEVKPRNIPVELMDGDFTLRTVVNGTNKDIVGNKFVKSNAKIKAYTEIVGGNTGVPDGNYQISDIIDIESEWRCFVYRDTLQGLQNYSGEFTIFPNVDIIGRMISAFKPSAPIAYTLDVGINDSGTFVIEVHDFFSCGLYGFDDHRVYPFMLSHWFNEFITR